MFEGSNKLEICMAALKKIIEEYINARATEKIKIESIDVNSGSSPVCIVRITSVKEEGAA